MPFPTSIDVELALKDADLIKYGDQGSSSRIAISTTIALTSDFTVEGWVKLQAHLPEIRQQLFVADFPPTDDVVLIASTEDVTPGAENLTQVYIRTDAGLQSFNGSKIPPRVWVHLCITFNESTGDALLYHNGILNASANYSGELLIHPSESKAGIGAHFDGGTGELYGWAREIRVWTDVRTPAEIIANMNVELTGGESNLLHLWHIDEGSGATITDDAGSADGTAINTEWEADQESPFWTAITADVLSAVDLTMNNGIRGGLRPTDRLAKPGKMKFTLDNSSSNSGALEGLYSPSHANALAGFNIGTKARLHIVNAGIDYYDGYGKIGSIKPRAGTKGLRTTKIVVEDWMIDAQRHRVELLGVGTEIRSDVLIQSIIDNMTEQPRTTILATGQETFPYVTDDLEEGRSTASSVLQKAVISEFGYAMPIGDKVGGGTFLFQDRHERIKNKTLELTISGGDVAHLQVEHDPSLILNRIDANVFPRNVGTSPETLAELDNPFELGIGVVPEVLKLSYRDPNSQDVTLSGQNMQDAEGQNELTSDERSFEGGSGGWYAAGSDSDVVVRETFFSKEGLWSLKLTSGTGAAHSNFAQTGFFPFVQNDVVYIQAWVYLESPWPNGVYLTASEFDVSEAYQTGATIDQTFGIGEWIRLAGTYTITDADTTQIAINVGQPGNANFSGGAVNCYIDEVYVIQDTALNFEFSSAEGGGGDKNTDLVLDGSVVGGSGAEYQLLNASSTDGFVTILKARGDAIRRYFPVTRPAEDALSKLDHGERPFKLNLAYQDDPRIGDDFADNTLAKYKDPVGWVKSVKFHANRSSTLLAGALEVQPGDRIKIVESVTGINEEFFVNHKMLRVFNKQFIDCTFQVTPAGAELFWLMGTVGASEIGTTTFVGF